MSAFDVGAGRLEAGGVLARLCGLQEDVGAHDAAEGNSATRVRSR
jgi:hypothetical protein